MVAGRVLLALLAVVAAWFVTAGSAVADEETRGTGSGPQRVRTARLRLVGGRWEIDPALSGVTPFDGRTITVRWTRPTVTPPEVAVTFAPPGLRAARRPEPHECAAILRVGPPGADGRLPVVGLASSHANGDPWPHRLGPATESVPVGRVFSPDLRLRAYSRRNPYRNAFTLVRIEDGDAAAAQPWSLADWATSIETDLRALAERARALPPGSAKDAATFAAQHRQPILESAGIATALPVPGAIESLKALERLFEGDEAAVHAAGTILLARFLAGDASRMEAPGWQEWARTADQTDLVLVMKPGGRFWARAAMLSPNPAVRDEAFRILGETGMSAAVAGDVLDGVHWARVDVPPAIRERLDRGPTENRTVLGAVAAHAGWFALLGAMLVAGIVLLVRQLLPSTSRTEGAALFTLGIAIVSLGLVTADADHASDFLGCLFASGGIRGIFREPSYRAARAASVLLLLAGIAELLTRTVHDAAHLREVAALLTALAILLVTGAACRREGRRVGLLFAVTWLAPVVAWHVAEIAALAGHPFPSPPRAVSAGVLALATVGTLWAVREIANAAAGLELADRAAARPADATGSGGGTGA
jgi:hypothetical protein